MNQKVTDLHDEFEIDHQVFLAHFQRLELSNAKLEKKIRDELKTDFSDTAIHRLRSGEKEDFISSGTCLSPLELYHYFLAKGVRKHGSEVIF